MPENLLNGRVELHCGDSLTFLRDIPDNWFDSIVTDPPYALVSIVKRFANSPRSEATENIENPYGRTGRGFMGKRWDTGETAFAVEFWAQCLRVLKPGGHVVAFGGTRTYHRLAVAIEDAGFEIRDMISWTYGAGFPKSHQLDKKRGELICDCDPISECGMRPVRDANVSPSGRSQNKRGKILQSGVPEQGASGAVLRSKSEKGASRGGKQGLERGRDAAAQAGQLRERPICSLPSGPDLNGSDGRLYNGASAGDGAVGGTVPHANGNSAPSGSYPTEQSAIEFGTLAGQSEPQDGGAWPHCGRCGKPMVTSGLGTALKPAVEPICLARKPLIGTVAENVLRYGVGALNIDGCRVGSDGGTTRGANGSNAGKARNVLHGGNFGVENIDAGRWPANLVHDGSEEVLAAFPEQPSGGAPESRRADKFKNIYGTFKGGDVENGIGGSSGSAARFFYTAKADSDDRLGSKHPTVKPVDLMQWLVRLVTPKGGLVLDPFAGTGTTAEACFREGMRCMLVEREEEYQADIRRRMSLVLGGPDERRRESIKAKTKDQPVDHGPLFDAIG